MARALEEVQGQWRQNLVQTGLKARERNFTQYKQPEISEQTRTLGAKPEEIKASEEQKWNSVKRVSKKSFKKKRDDVSPRPEPQRRPSGRWRQTGPDVFPICVLSLWHEGWMRKGGTQQRIRPTC